MKRSYSCVPGQQLQHVLGADDGEQEGLGVAVEVEKKTQPPGLTRRAQARTVDAGSGTCSSISMQVTTSKLPGCSAASASALISR
jgi:hypothetical protein